MGIKTRNFANNILSGGTIDGTDFLSGTLPSSNITNDSAASVTSIPSISNVVSTVAGDPPSPTLGDIWYNSSTNALKFQGFQAAAWASGGNYPISVREFYGVGTLTAGLGFNGTIAPGVTNVSAEYDGTSWGNTATTNASKRARAGSGTQTAGLTFGGEPDTGETEEYNGSAWTEVNDLGTARYALNGSGTQTAGLAIGGRVSAASPGAVEEWDGTNWTAGGAQPVGTSYAGSCGTQTATVVFGNSPSASVSTFEYNGTSWSSGGDLPTPISTTSGAGTQTAALQAGGGEGSSPIYGTSNSYDGSAWTAVATMSTARRNLASSASGPSTNSMVFGGYDGPPGFTNVTEEFTGAGGVAKTFTTD